MKNLALNKRTHGPLILRNCMKYGKLVLMKIIETVATRCHILKLKCIKFYFRPQILLGKLTALLRPLVRFKGA